MEATKRANNATNCHKFLKTFVSEKLEAYCDKEEMINFFKEKETPIYFVDNFLMEYAVKWTREEQIVVNDEVTSTSRIIKKDVDEKSIMLLQDYQTFIPLIFQSLKLLRKEETSGETMHDLVRYYITEHEKDLTIIIYGQDKYLNEVKKRQNEDYMQKQGISSKNSKATEPTLPVITKFDIDLVVLDISLRTKEILESDYRVHFIAADSRSQVSKLIWTQTRALALATIKSQNEHGLDWFAQNDAIAPQDITTDSDITKLWIKQLATVPKMSEEMAKEIVKKYSTPRCLLQAYNRCESEQEKSDLLSNIEIVKNNYAHGKANRKIGAQLSHKIFLIMTSTIPETIIN